MPQNFSTNERRTSVRNNEEFHLPLLVRAIDYPPQTVAVAQKASAPTISAHPRHCSEEPPSNPQRSVTAHFSETINQFPN